MENGEDCQVGGFSAADSACSGPVGSYCPKEHQQHLELAANYSKIAVAYTQIATIATDDHHTLQEFRASAAGPERAVGLRGHRRGHRGPGIERGHRTLMVTRKGGKVVTIPLAPRTARAIDLAVGERSPVPDLPFC